MKTNFVWTDTFNYTMIGKPERARAGARIHPTYRKRHSGRNAAEESSVYG